MTTEDSNPTIATILVFHPDDYEAAFVASYLSKMDIKDFIRLATHEKAKAVLPPGGLPRDTPLFQPQHNNRRE